MDNLPLWYLTILLYFVGATTVSLLQRKLAQNSKVPLGLLPALVFAIIVYPIAVVVSLASGNLHMTVNAHSLLLLFAASILIGAFNVLPFHLSRHVDATQYVILNNLYTPLTVFLGVFVLNEAFTGKQFFGMVLLVIGAVLVAVKGIKRSTLQFDRWTVYCALASLILGVGLAIERASLNYMSASAYMLFGWGLQTITTITLAWRDWPAIRKLTRLEWKDIVKVGLARTGQVMGFFLSVAISRNVSLVATVTSFRIPLVFIAGFFLLRERDHLLRKSVGVIIATIGLVLV